MCSKLSFLIRRGTYTGIATGKTGNQTLTYGAYVLAVQCPTMWMDTSKGMGMGQYHIYEWMSAQVLQDPVKDFPNPFAKSVDANKRVDENGRQRY